MPNAPEGVAASIRDKNVELITRFIDWMESNTVEGQICVPVPPHRNRIRTHPVGGCAQRSPDTPHFQLEQLALLPSDVSHTGGVRSDVKDHGHGYETGPRRRVLGAFDEATTGS